MDFKLYDLIWYWEILEAIDNPCIGRWLGVSHQVRSALCYWILTDKGTVLFHTEFHYETIDEAKEPKIPDKVKDYKGTRYGNLRDPKYIYTEYDFEGFIMYD